MPRYRVKKTVTETTEETSIYEAIIDAPSERDVERLARQVLGKAWEYIDGNADGGEETEYEILETLPSLDGESDPEQPVRGSPADYGLAQPNLLSAAQEEETKA